MLLGFMKEPKDKIDYVKGELDELLWKIYSRQTA